MHVISSIYLCYVLRSVIHMSLHCITSSPYACQPVCIALQYCLPYLYMSDCDVPNWEATSQLGNY